MNIQMLKAASAGLVLSISGFANAGLIEHVVNGDFETGNTSGWTIINSVTTWNINNGTYEPSGPSVVTAPISGGYDIVSNQNSPSIASFYQDLVLANSFDSITLSWDDRIRSHASYEDPEQEFKVRMFDSNLGLINEVYSTNPGDTQLQNGPNNRSYDLTSALSSFAGQLVRLEFYQNTQRNYFNVNIDNVSLKSETVDVPEPSTLVIFALGMIGLASRRFKKHS
jgi:hypothetical protein